MDEKDLEELTRAEQLSKELERDSRRYPPADLDGGAK